jgi:beta-galactosidase GanA
MVILLSLASTAAFSQANIPHLAKQGTATQLIVDGKPFLVLGSELNNSSGSSLEYMRPLWPKIAATNLNTVLATASWELMEPEEGRFDFSLVDGLIQDARRYNLHLIMIWFGSWKNGKSTYQPLWIKANQQRFPLVQDEKGKGLPIMSTFSDANRDADSRAFAAMMKHIREVDGEAHTVIMIQVENEVGVLGESRDHSPAANKAFAGPVPKEFLDYLQKHKDTLIPEMRQRWEATGFKTSGSWAEVFGAGTATDEIFMAWNYARYIGHVAAAGKAEYPLPMFVNTWLRQDGKLKPGEDIPGGYPSGGPLAQVMDVWRAGGPAIDILSPDVHVPNYSDWCDWYTQSGNPLFIPESRGDARGIAWAIATAGKYDGIGYSPFGIDRLANPDGELAKGYQLLGQVAPLILEKQGLGQMTAVLLDKETPRSKVRLGDYTIEARFAARAQDPNAPVAAPVDSVAGLFIRTGPDDYAIVGRSMNIYFESATDSTQSVGLASADEGQFVDGRWVPGRRLNGDETPDWRALWFPGDRYSIQKIKLYRYR